MWMLTQYHPNNWRAKYTYNRSNFLPKIILVKEDGRELKKYTSSASVSNWVVLLYNNSLESSVIPQQLLVLEKNIRNAKCRVLEIWYLQIFCDISDKFLYRLWDWHSLHRLFPPQLTLKVFNLKNVHGLLAPDLLNYFPQLCDLVNFVPGHAVPCPTESYQESYQDTWRLTTHYQNKPATPN